MQDRIKRHDHGPIPIQPLAFFRSERVRACMDGAEWDSSTPDIAAGLSGTGGLSRRDGSVSISHRTSSLHSKTMSSCSLFRCSSPARSQKRSKKTLQARTGRLIVSSRRSSRGPAGALDMLVAQADRILILDRRAATAIDRGRFRTMVRESLLRIAEGLR